MQSACFQAYSRDALFSSDFSSDLVLDENGISEMRCCHAKALLSATENRNDVTQGGVFMLDFVNMNNRKYSNVVKEYAAVSHIVHCL